MPPINNINFHPLIAQETNARMRIRLIALSHIQDGASNTQTARYLKVSRHSVNNWVKQFNEEGIAGLKEKSRSGRPSRLSPNQQKQLSIYIRESNIKLNGNNSSAPIVLNYIKHEFGIEYKLKNIYRILNQLNFS
ncbi:transposase [Psychromonas sp. RZ22]|uniref:helix-turn-helix domain-containing protein n=1 Tax=Psychromonas algarum TaxID=2555643 RepID=UPI0010672845|nr:helix-turn-helix domain-containing protein [Psychromonas sp. RZ22]TEW55677.1 transposase [Psychromonas sp. RZ22]